MKTTKDKLKQLILEELDNIISEQGRSGMAGMERDDDAFAQMLAKQAGASSKTPEKAKVADTLKDMLNKLKDKISAEFKGMEDKEGMSETALMDLLNKLEGDMRGEEA